MLLVRLSKKSFVGFQLVASLAARLRGRHQKMIERGQEGTEGDGIIKREGAPCPFFLSRISKHLRLYTKFRDGTVVINTPCLIDPPPPHGNYSNIPGISKKEQNHSILFSFLLSCNSHVVVFRVFESVSH